MSSDEAPQDPPGIAFVDGRYMPLAQASVPLLDRGFVRSDATYDVAHVWKGRFFRLDDHLERFERSMAGLRMSLPYSRRELADIMVECVRRSGLRDAYVQVTCTRGIPPAGSRDPRLCRNRLYVFAQPFVWIADERARREGLSLTVASVERIPSESLDQRIKNFHWLDLTMGIFEAYERGAALVVLPDRHGHLTEGPGFNVFIVKDGRLATPDRGLFEGMTRRTVIEIAAQTGIACDLRPVSAGELASADEIFVTSTAGGVLPITRCEGRVVGDGAAGPLTRRLHDAYWRRHESGPDCLSVDYTEPTVAPANSAAS